MKKLDNKLIIGIGNNTRKDDGLGWYFLDILKDEGFNTENLLYKYQLMVEDAELVSNYNTVIFVDACKTDLEDGYEIERIYPSEQVAFSTHEVPPNQILNLCETIYHKNPKSYIVKIQGYKWDFEIGLSQEAKSNLTKAVQEFTRNYS
ncbi:hydrogenase maturation protease [Lutibacter sp. B1]|uniref:hydrogenase maturation protease n=1 Tax=Lutibacter sp. B1 TaxID=2725996 RepID=UPI0014572FDA|nr:hydrogenase maturation protease [Lutibacter sp. B1]NLP58458.1 hydrogenase maturation protease [Lutibacter sp. B1]